MKNNCIEILYDLWFFVVISFLFSPFKRWKKTISPLPTGSSENKKKFTVKSRKSHENSPQKNAVFLTVNFRKVCDS